MSAWIYVFIAWVTALVASFGSLFFSEVMKYPPCVLCWYQRIAMYPLTLILLVGLFPLQRSLFKYSVPLAFIGWWIAGYHNLLYYQVLPESASPCLQGVSCTSVHLQWMGFITIPLLSLTAFSMILFCLIQASRNYEK
jgi:disulfide bond formation protein DsbB